MIEFAFRDRLRSSKNRVVVVESIIIQESNIFKTFGFPFLLFS